MLNTKEFRDALGCFATGVCVVTTTLEDGTAIGMTINSFSSVSLEPALVLWSIQLSSECYETFNQCDKFAINILSAPQQSLSNLYAKKGGHLLETGQFTLGSSGSPLLEDVMATFECRTWAKYPGGDHTIIIGEVDNFVVGDTSSPLLFYKGKYGQLSE
ncbi:flavin reductase family protein [Halioxenophilus sp. WMMB6]|uniref:flavin reductase family protein n=1 Tax=Halioxenophilus sp. WMMB6 TaxID=3073815 RepID=UPI00295E883E|nr:flavin reductase family protein [Halioxenophilus sp. WMMB6]